MRVLMERDGFPTLPQCEIGLLRGHREENAVTEALVSHIKRSLNAMTAPNYNSVDVFVDVEAIARPPRNRSPVMAES